MLFLVLALLFPVGGIANAASTDRFSTEGGEIRLVTTGGIDRAGKLKGALEIALLPGWKTYWIDPGDAGVPPRIDVSASRDVTSAGFLFPPPQRFDDGYTVWAGYKNHVSLALEFETAAAPYIEADVFLGLCEKICIPVQIRFSLDPSVSNDTSEHAAIVASAFSALPGEPNDMFRLDTLRLTGPKTIRAEITAPDSGVSPELFVVSADGWYFGTPMISPDGRAYDIPLLARPGDGGEPPEISYILVSSDAAVSGKINLTATAAD